MGYPSVEEAGAFVLIGVAQSLDVRRVMYD